MRVALTIWENRISPLLDSSHMLLVADVENRTVTTRHYEPFHHNSPFARAAKLADLGVEVLICGGVTEWFANFIETYGIQIIPFVAGTIDQVLDAYLKGTISGSDALRA